MRLNKERMGLEEYEKIYDHAVRHLKFTLELYQQQMDHGGWFLHEHPEGANSWHIDEVITIINQDGEATTTGNMSMYGMLAKTDEGDVRPVRKSTRFMRNSLRILRQLSK